MYLNLKYQFYVAVPPAGKNFPAAAKAVLNWMPPVCEIKHPKEAMMVGGSEEPAQRLPCPHMCHAALGQRLKGQQKKGYQEVIASSCNPLKEMAHKVI